LFITFHSNNICFGTVNEEISKTAPNMLAPLYTMCYRTVEVTLRSFKSTTSTKGTRLYGATTFIAAHFVVALFGVACFVAGPFCSGPF